jgi:hypothetical protein
VPRIFICYRRDDASGYAGRLYDDLTAHFGRGQVFMDVGAIEPGLDGVEVIERSVESSDVLLAVIGKQWLTSTDAKGQRRLNDPYDFIRLEIQTALERGVRVIPVLVQGAAMPGPEALPEAIAQLARRQAHEASDARWQHDVDRLVEVLKLIDQQTERRLNQTGAWGKAASWVFAAILTLLAWDAAWLWGYVAVYVVDIREEILVSGAVAGAVGAGLTCIAVRALGWARSDWWPIGAVTSVVAGAVIVATAWEVSVESRTSVLGSWLAAAVVALLVAAVVGVAGRGASREILALRSVVVGLLAGVAWRESGPNSYSHWSIPQWSDLLLGLPVGPLSVAIFASCLTGAWVITWIGATVWRQRSREAQRLRVRPDAQKSARSPA